MKPFSLEEYLKNPNRKVVTRDGRPVRIICTDKRSLNFPVVALVPSKIEDGEITYTYSTEGRNLLDKESRNDIFFAPEKHEGWINIYRAIPSGGPFYKFIHPSEEEAKRNAGCSVIATVKIEWEE